MSRVTSFFSDSSFYMLFAVATMLLQQRRQIEAINGAWAMIGLTAGLVIEGQTGNSILSQVPSFSCSPAVITISAW